MRSDPQATSRLKKDKTDTTVSDHTCAGWVHLARGGEEPDPRRKRLAVRRTHIQPLPYKMGLILWVEYTPSKSHDSVDTPLQNWDRLI